MSNQVGNPEDCFSRVAAHMFVLEICHGTSVYSFSSEGLEKPESEPTTPGLEGKWLHYTREASQGLYTERP